MHKGLALYRSLLKNCLDFHLYIMAFDFPCYEKLKNLGLNNVTIRYICDFETEELISLKDQRTKAEYPEFRYFDTSNLTRTMQDVYQQTKCPFVVIIDEWDCVFREYKTNRETQERYLDFLRDLLKDKGYIHLAYMTGILPIKKYGTHSALNMFDEFSMIEPGPLASYVGFTETEVQKLCGQYDMELEEAKNWYDGYSFDKALSVYSPRSVVSCMRLGKIGNYWNQTETFEALQVYIDMNFDGLKDDESAMSAHHLPTGMSSCHS